MPFTIYQSPSRTPAFIRKPEGSLSAQAVFVFPNNRGASVVQGPLTYGGEDGLYELAVLRLVGQGGALELDYNTPITDDVLGCLPQEEVEKYLEMIEALPTELTP